MSKSSVESIEARFVHPIFSPHGTVEGALLDAAGRPIQIVFERDDESGPLAIEAAATGQTLVVEAVPSGPSDKGPAEHPVYAFRKLKSIDGKRPSASTPSKDDAYRGRVVRFNYARHGAANGFVLDSGDFIHTKPEGFAKLKVRIGDDVVAEGDARQLASGDGWAVDAVTVNGKAVKGH